MIQPETPAAPPAPPNRWIQLAAGVAGMVAVANLQYGWTFFVGPLGREHPSWPEGKIQLAFTLFVLAETWLVPIEAFLADLFGPRRLVAAGGLLGAGGWVLNSVADSLAVLYLGNVLAGMGAGIVYGISMGSALRWFPDRRGLAAGLTSAAFGAGSALTVAPIRYTIRVAGYRSAFLWFGLGQGLVVLAAALVLRSPRPGDLPAAAAGRVEQSHRDFSPLEMLATPTFWLLYVMMTMVTVGGLMAIAQLEPMARSYGIADYPLMLVGVTVTALTLAASIDRVLNGLTRPFFGWMSDHIGRERTMFIAFTLEACAILLLINFAAHPVWFVVLTGLTFFAWGEIYSLFPAVSADLFGRRYATTNYALLYTAKGTASLLVPLGSYLHQQTGSWKPIFALAVVFDIVTAILAITALRWLRRRARPAAPHSNP